MRPAVELIALRCAEQIDELGVALRKIPQDDPEPFPEYVKERIKSGDYEARELYSAGRPIGWTVYQVENFPSGHRELVSIATVTQSTRPHRYEIETALLEQAKALGCHSIRMHTARAGLVKEAIGHGYHVAEIVLRKPVK